MGRDAIIRDASQRPPEVNVWGFRARVSRWLLPALIMVIALVLRLAPLNRYVTPDEPAWVQRSIRFSQALTSGDLKAIPATGHPGVTTMWLGGLGLLIQRWLAPDQATIHLDWLDGLAGLSPESPAAFLHLSFFLSAGRVIVALVTSLGLLGTFVLAGRLWGRRIAVLAALLLALDPFLAGHSGLLHLDGLLATGMTLSALMALQAVCPAHPTRLGGTFASAVGREAEPAGNASIPAPSVVESGTEWGAHLYRWMALSGLLAGLAVLTKTPAGFLAPFVAALLGAAWLTRRVSGRQAILALVSWGLVAGLTLLVLYPAFWTDPVGTLRGLLDVGGRHVEGALRPIFFHGRTTFDPPRTFYLVVWLFRTSPLVLIGAPTALLAYLRRPGSRRFSIFALLALALGFGLLITLAGKKHDRYLLPAFPPLTLVAALGWEQVGELVGGQLAKWRWLSRARKIDLRFSTLLFMALILIQLLLALPYLSAPLGYFNPLLGGPRAALNWLPLSWGEGEGAAARWLNQHPDAERLIVATPSIPPFASLFVGQTVELDQETLYHADYILQPPLQGTEKPLASEMQTAVYDKRVGGVSYAKLIRNPAPGEQAAYLAAHARADDLIILDAEAALSGQYDGPADLVVLADARNPVQVATRLDALIPGREHLWYVALPAASPITAGYIQRELACRGQAVASDTVSGTTITGVVLDSPQACAADRDTQYERRFTFRVPRSGDALALVDALLPDDPIAWPDHLPVVVRWEALASLAADYRTILHLKDDAGRIWREGGQEILDGDYQRPSAWLLGHWSDQTFQLGLPAGIPPGDYTVELGVFDPVSGQGLSAWDAAGLFAGVSASLGHVTIAPPARPPTPWDVAMAERLTPPPVAGPLALLGYDPPPQRIPSGDRGSFDLFWQATRDPGTGYALRWRLALPAGDVRLEQIVPLSPFPTDLWRAQELEQVRYGLPVSPDLPAGDYSLSVNVLDADGAPIWSEDVDIARVEVLARDRLFDLPSDIAYPLDFRLGSVVHLRGFDIGTLSAGPGEKFPLTLYWQADGPTELSYTVFVHLVGPDGMLHGQEDRPPAGGAAPTHSWAPGQVIIDDVLLPVFSDAPPGTYHIAVGLYDPLSADRLPVYDATGAQLPDGQIVLPIEVRVE